MSLELTEITGGAPTSLIEENISFLRGAEGRHFKVVDGRIMSADLFDRIAEVIVQILSALLLMKEEASTPLQGAMCDICLYLDQYGTDDEIRDLFARVLSRVDKRSFKRCLLSQRVQCVLCPELREFSGQTELTEQQQLAWSVAKINLALKLGIKPINPATGATGALVYRDIEEKPVGLFKPGLLSNAWNVRRAVKKALGIKRQNDYCRQGGKLPDMYPEIAAYLADRHFGFHLTPITGEAELEGAKGSLMLWERNCESAAAFLPSPDGPSQEELELFQSFALFDYLIGNLDRHKNNYLIQQSKGHLTRIIAIDHSNSFLEKNLGLGYSDFFNRAKQYGWRSHPFAGCAFTPNSRSRMRAFTKEAIGGLIAQLKERFEGTLFVSEELIAHMHERAAVMRSLGEREGASPKLLSSYFSDEGMSRLERRFL
jgi:hypothetical protein